VIIFELGREAITGENYVMWNVKSCIVQQILLQLLKT
jgi:hypothetical protein